MTLVTSTYIKNLEKKQELLIREQKELLMKQIELEKKLDVIKERKEKVFLGFHDLRQQIEVEIEKGFPHGRK